MYRLICSLGLNGQKLGWAWYDRSKKEDNTLDAYWSSSRWPEEGPCVKIGTSTTLEAETMSEHEMIYTCPRLWNLESRKEADLKADTTLYGPKGTIDIDLKRFPDLGYYQSPATTILYGMIHQLFGGRM
jgi:hypothetical protein